MLNMGNIASANCVALFLCLLISTIITVFIGIILKVRSSLKKELDSYIYFYNNKREQHYLKYLSPAQFELQMT